MAASMRAGAVNCFTVCARGACSRSDFVATQTDSAFPGFGYSPRDRATQLARRGRLTPRHWARHEERRNPFIGSRFVARRVRPGNRVAPPPDQQRDARGRGRCGRWRPGGQAGGRRNWPSWRCGPTGPAHHHNWNTRNCRQAGASDASPRRGRRADLDGRPACAATTAGDGRCACSASGGWRVQSAAGDRRSGDRGRRVRQMEGRSRERE
jgi:hypothetical protein